MWPRFQRWCIYSQIYRKIFTAVVLCNCCFFKAKLLDQSNQFAISCYQMQPKSLGRWELFSAAIYRSSLCCFLFFIIIILVWEGERVRKERQRKLFVWVGRNFFPLRVSCSYFVPCGYKRSVKSKIYSLYSLLESGLTLFPKKLNNYVSSFF